MTGFRFIHTADLHLGRRFGNFPEDIRGRLVEARHEAIHTLARNAHAQAAAHILVAGDLFDTETPSETVLRQALEAMGHAADLHWWLLPGNHDSLAAESLSDRIRASSPDNVRFVDSAQAIEMAPGATLLPAPVPSRFPGRDATEWMAECATPADHIRLGVAHGGVVSFGSEFEHPETIPPDRAATAGLDYLALGDWHGDKRINERTFYSGAPERDRFKHPGRGVCLAVEIASPGAAPAVERIETGRFAWFEHALPLTPEQDAEAALSSLLSESSFNRRDTLLRVSATGWTRLPQRSALTTTAANVGPEFGFFELKDEALNTERAADDLDEISEGGALRMAAQALLEEAGDTALSAEKRGVADAALRRLHGYVTGESA